MFRDSTKTFFQGKVDFSTLTRMLTLLVRVYKIYINSIPRRAFENTIFLVHCLTVIEDANGDKP